MRRAALIGVLLAAALAPAAHAAMPAGVKLLACEPALLAADRSATFEARVRPLRGSLRMQVRFTLQTRAGAPEPWRRVLAPGLDDWLTSAPGVSRYTYAKTVQNLPAPAAYRVLVRFRWLDADGAVLARTRVTSDACRQPDMRPDLVAARIDVFAPLGPGPAQYAVALRNDGRTAAGAFAVALRAGDAQLDPLTVPGLAPGERRVVTFTGPRCAPGVALTATVDTELAVDERDEQDNVLVAQCPA
jgi:hypothetical protein